MITFLDEAGKEYGALSEVKLTNAVNGERSLTGDIYTNPNVLNKIDKGWRLRFGDEYFVVTYAKPIDNGRKTQVSFDAVHQFFWDFQKNPVYSQLSDGSHTFQAYLDFIFDGSGYSYTIDSGLKVKAFEKQSFGMKNRLTLFNDIIKTAGVEFAINGKVVRILEQVGTDLSTIVRKNFNMSDFKIEKNIGNFITYQKGFGAWKDSEDHSKGRLEVEYESPLAKVYGRLSTDPVVDERYTQKDSLLAVLKENVDNSYTISVGLSMEDLTRAGYSYTKPIAGDYIMAINEQIGFREKIRIVSFTSSYDVRGQLIEHTVTCNDLGTVQKQTATYSKLSDAVAANAELSKNAVVLAQQAMVSADGKNRVYFGTTYPTDVPKGTLTKGDQLYLTVGDQVKMYYWNGAEWLPVPVVNDVERFKADIAQQFSDVNQQMTDQQQAHDRAVADILSQAESAQSLAEQAKTIGDQAKADAVNLASQLNTAKTALQNSIAEAQAQAVTVDNNLATAKSDLQNQVTAIDAKAVQAQRDITQAKSELQTQAAQLNAQAAKQVELTKLTTDTKKLADGTITSLNELTKTVDKNTGNITSVANRTKTVEDSLVNVKTSYTQLNQTVNTQTGQIDSINRKTADLQSGIDGVTEKFENIRVGSRNILRGTKDMPLGSGTWSSGTWRKSGIGTIENVTVTDSPIPSISQGIKISVTENNAQIGFAQDYYKIAAGTYTQSIWIKGTAGAHIILQPYWNNDSGLVRKKYTLDGTWQRLSITAQIPAGVYSVGYVYIVESQVGSEAIVIANYMDASSLVLDWSAAEEDTAQQIAEYKRTADQNYSGLQSTISTLDGKITQNKTSADQTAEAIKSRLTSLETYKNAEGTRAQAYFEAAKTETAKQITAERTAITQNYVAKSTYQEDAAGVTRRLSATETVANRAQSTADTAKANATTVTTRLATYQEANDRRVAALETAKTSTDGTLTQLSNKVEQNAQQTRETISAVEAKIPTNFDGMNLMTGTRDWSNKGNVWHHGGGWVVENDTYQGCVVRSTTVGFNGSHQNIFVKNGDKVTFSFFAKATQSLSNVKISSTWTGSSVYKAPVAGVKENDVIIQVTSDWKRYSLTVTIISDGSLQFRAEYGAANLPSGNRFYIAGLKVAKTSVDTGYSENPNDLATEISNAKLDITKTADGLKLVADKSTANANMLTQHTTQITALNNELSAKVSKTDYNTLTGRMTSAEITIQAQAGEISKRLTSTQVESAITAKGYQTKAQVDSNITGRGYITSSALQPYVTTTVFQNTVKETSSSFERKITETKALIPTEQSAGNMLKASNVGVGPVHSSFLELALPIEKGKEYTLVQHWWSGSEASHSNGSPQLAIDAGMTVENKGYYDAVLKYDSKIDSWFCTFTSPVTVKAGTRIRFANTDIKSKRSDGIDGTGYWSFTTLVRGSLPLSVWQPAFSELATVTAFNLVKDTVDAHKRIIGDGSSISSAIQSAKKFEQQIASGGEIYQAIATTKGLVTTVSGTNGLTTQVSQLAGSYAIKNLTNAGTVLNQLNLNKDGTNRIDGKLTQITGKTYIENGVIKDAMISNLNAGKITAGTLDASKVNVINLNASNIVSGTMTADRIKGGMLTSMNGNTTFDLNNGNLIFNNNYGYIRRSVNNKVFEISSKLYEATSLSSEHLQVDLMVRKNDYSRKAGISFLIFDTYNGKNSSSTEIATDSLTIYGSNSTGNMLTITNDNTFLGNVTVASWSEKNIMNFNGGIRSNDIVIGSKMKPLSKIIKELCDKAGLIWI